MTRNSEQRLRELVVKACRTAYSKDLVAATDGNISARVGRDKVLITPSGVSKGDVRPQDLLLCDMDGRKLRGPGAPSFEIQVHLAAYRQRPNVGGVLHAHPTVTSAFMVAGLAEQLSAPVMPEVVAHIGPIPTVPYFAPGTRALADAFEPAIRRCDVVLLLQHGAVAVGKDPWAAYLQMEKLEHFATIMMIARQLSGGWNLTRFTKRQVAELRAYAK